MKVKAKIVLDYCSRKQEECEYTYNGYEDLMDTCDDYFKYGESCLYFMTKEIFIDKDYKNVSIEYGEYGNDIVLNIGRKRWINEVDRYYDIEYLYIDDKPIVEDYKLVRENLRESF